MECTSPRGTTVRRDRDCRRRRQGSGAFEHRNLVRLHQRLYAADHLRGYVTAAVYCHAKVEFQVVVADAPLRRATEEVGDLGAVEEGLARNAAPVEAHAAQAAALDAGDFLAELRGTDGADISGGPAADHDQVVM